MCMHIFHFFIVLKFLLNPLLIPRDLSSKISGLAAGSYQLSLAPVGLGSWLLAYVGFADHCQR